MVENYDVKLVALFTVCILLAGCNIFDPGPDKPIDVSYNAVHSGGQGIAFEFARDRPLDSYVVVPSGNDITVIVGLENKGAWDVLPTKGVLALNYDKTYMHFEPTYKDFELGGRSLFRSKGEKVFKDFNGRISPLQEVKKDTHIFAVACYEYETEYIFDICIDTDPTNTQTTNKACDVLQNKKKYSSMSGGQGGPVSISALDQAIRIRDNNLDIDFIIKLANVGKGKIYDIGTTPQALCLEGGSINYADKVRITADLAGQELQCDTVADTPGIVNVYNDIGGVVNCRALQYTSVRQPSFLSKLKVTVTYNYVDTTGKAVTLKKAGARV